MATKVFSRTGSVNPARSVFDLSYSKALTCDMGQLIPIVHDMALPGDTWDIGSRVVLRFQPLLAPLMWEINVTMHYFFIPFRLLWELWEQWITRGTDGNFTDVIPRWEVSGSGNDVGTLWDFFGFPVNVSPQPGGQPLDFIRQAYNLVWNQYYRDENLQDEIELDNELVLNRAWTKDYFTSALPFQLRGTAPALPISGMTNAVFTGVSGELFPTYFINASRRILTDGTSNVIGSQTYGGSGATLLMRTSVPLRMISRTITWFRSMMRRLLTWLSFGSLMPLLALRNAMLVLALAIRSGLRLTGVFVLRIRACSALSISEVPRAPLLFRRSYRRAVLTRPLPKAIWQVTVSLLMRSSRVSTACKSMV